MGWCALMLWACSDGSDDTGVPNAAGQPAENDSAGQSPGGGGGEGGGGAQAGQGGSAGTGEPACEPRPLEECATCPQSPDDFDFGKTCGTDPDGSERGVDKSASDCDGVVVRVWGDKHNGFDYYSTSYSFDADGTLIGYSSSTDVADDCPAVGVVCAPVGEPESLCPEGGAGGQGGGGAGGAMGGQGGSP